MTLSQGGLMASVSWGPDLWNLWLRERLTFCWSGDDNIYSLDISTVWSRLIFFGKYWWTCVHTKLHYCTYLLPRLITKAEISFYFYKNWDWILVHPYKLAVARYGLSCVFRDDFSLTFHFSIIYCSRWAPGLPW